jgi:diguanylate cyclase (GGDEF)-like protein/PAS domain S-box-containing protein
MSSFLPSTLTHTRHASVPWDAPVATVSTGLSGRLRGLLYAVFAVLAAVVIAQALVAQQWAEQRIEDAELVAQAGREQADAQQAIWQASFIAERSGHSPAEAEALASLLAHWQHAGAAFEQRLQAAAPGHWPAARHPVRDAWADWSQARQDTLDQGARLRVAVAATVAAAAELPDYDWQDIAGAARTLRIRAELTREAAHGLGLALASAAEVRSREQQQRSQWWGALTLVLLGVLALLVVEPTARGLRRQVDRLDAQARHLRMLALVAERTEAMVMITDRENRIVWANEAFTRITGWPLEEATGCRPGELIHSPEIGPADLSELQAAIAEGRGTRLECLNRDRRGNDLWLDCDLQPLHDSAGAVVGFVSVNHDVTDRRRLQAQLQSNARTDALTRLPNREVVMDRLQRAIAHARRHPGYGFAVLFMDFDRFKQVNDTLGHSAGDELLRQAAQRLQTALRPGDEVGRVDSPMQLAARLGGDEFVVVLEGVSDPVRVGAIAERVLAVLAEPYLIAGQVLRSAASIGVVVSTGRTVRGTQVPATEPDADQAGAGGGDGAADGAGGWASIETEAESVLRDADTAMYEAKRSRRGGWMLFDRSMQERVVHALQLESDLRLGLAEGQLFLVYQPVVQLGSGALAGVEALARWRHPTRGLVPPMEFIVLAEECGLIEAVGRFALREACAQFARWRSELGPAAPPIVAVNLSRAQLGAPGLLAEVRAALHDHGLQPRELQLEVTETLAAQGEEALGTLRALREMGVRLALDDFGTGYSSLACLDQMPVGTVKIDRQFVALADQVEYRRVLIEATIRVAKTLDMLTVAEGIETEAQAQQMRALQCDLGQGYHFSRPLPGHELARWARERREMLRAGSQALTAG